MAKETRTKSSGKKVPIIAGFELQQRVGRGGMGTVYRARQVSVDRTVAIKILKPRLAINHSFIKRFKEEAKAAAQLNHPNIVQAIDAGEQGGYYYFAMEFVDGETLIRRMLREGLLPEPMVLKVAYDVAVALSHAFQHGIVHRDIKPGNIMLSHKSETKLCDLGLARVLADEDFQIGKGAAVGTPYYISPEQARGVSEVDCRSDIYSLGATLYRALVGQPVFNAPTPAGILDQHVHTPMPWPKDYNPDLSENICYVIAKMMAKTPDERYQTPEKLIDDLQHVITGERPKSTVTVLEIPPVRLSEEERAEKAMTRTRLRKKRDAVAQFAQVRNIIDKVSQEQSLPSHAVVRLLRGNMDETSADTFLKYGIILLAEKKFTLARGEFHRAQALGADVSPFMTKLDALGAPLGMVYIPAGEATIGPPESQRSSELPAYYIDANMVTNRKYHDFMRATGHSAPPHWLDSHIPEGMAEFPVINTTWEEAVAYAKWCEKRLPTADEWEKAARGYDERAYPWGKEFDPLRCNTIESDHGDLTEAGRYPRGKSPYGCYDMYGNALQWCQDRSPAPGEEADGRAVRGVAFDETGADNACWRIQFLNEQDRSGKCGFRCALDV